ncbi:MAG: preprotein translocase subunit SecE, partial [Candidatus Izemoplasmatales bacterium]
MADIEKEILDKEAKKAAKAEVKAKKAEAKAKAREARLAMTPEEKHSRVMEILKKEYKFENWLLAILAPVLLLYGVYIVSGDFGTVDLAKLLGNSQYDFINWFFNTDLKRILTGSFLILIGTLVIVYLAIPFFKPSFAELKKVSWPTGKELGKNSIRVFGFLLFLMFVFIIYGFALDPL